MIDIVIADDHRLFADGLAQGLGAIPDLRVVAMVGDGLQLLELLEHQPTDVLVIDLEMPRLDGIAALRKLDAVPPTLVVTMHADATQRRRALESGAAGFLSKSVPLTDLAAAIRAVAAGERLDDTTTLSDVLERHRAPILEPAAASLTPRERELLQLLADGVTATDELADALFISHKTVKNHLANIYDKLSVSDRAQAAVEAIRLGIAHRT